MRKKNKVIIAIFLFILIFSFFLYNFIKSVNNNIMLENHYNDYNRASIIFSLSYYKNINEFYNNIRHQQRYNKSDKLELGELIYNMKEYNVLDYLKYLNCKTDDIYFINSFYNFFEFLQNINYKYNKDPEGILIKNDNGKYYTYEDGIYTYKINKLIPTQNTLDKLFKTFLVEKKLDQDTYFIDALWKTEKIQMFYKKNGGYTSLKRDVNDNYESFYNKFEEEVLNVLTDINNSFGEFLQKYTIITEEYIDFKDELELENIELIYKFSKVQKIYNDGSIYSTFLFSTDLDYIWEQLSEINKSIIFM